MGSQLLENGQARATLTELAVYRFDSRGKLRFHGIEQSAGCALKSPGCTGAGLLMFDMALAKGLPAARVCRNCRAELLDVALEGKQPPVPEAEPERLGLTLKAHRRRR